MSDDLPADEQALIASLHSAALDPLGWQEFILLLEGALPGVAATLFGVDGNRRRLTYVTTGGGIGPEGLRAFADYYNTINPFNSYLVQVLPGTTRRSVLDVPDDVLLRTEFYNDWLLPQDNLAGGVALKTQTHQDRALIIAVNIRRHYRATTDQRTQKLLDRLQPHVTHAFRVSETIAELRSRQMLGITGLVPGQLGGTVICDHNLLIIWADPGVTSMLGGPLRIDRIGRLGFADPKAQLWAANLAAALGNGRAPFGTMHSHDLGGWTIRAISGAAPTLSSPLFPGVFQTAGWPDRQLAFVISRRDQICSIEGHLIRRFQLSAAEASIAALIGQGCSTAEVARTRQVSLHTVRNQIRAILQKMDARDRGAIIREIAIATVQRH